MKSNREIFLLKRDSDDEFIFTRRDSFVLEKIVKTVEEAIQWIKNVHVTHDYMVIGGEEIEFGISEQVVVDVLGKSEKIVIWEA